LPGEKAELSAPNKTLLDTPIAEIVRGDRATLREAVAKTS
jgi:hypothetical protein